MLTNTASNTSSRTQQHAYLRYAHSHHIESHLGKKQPQAKIATAFLFGQLHFNNVTSHALFYGGHLVMRSKRCAMQNQGITFMAASLIFKCIEGAGVGDYSSRGRWGAIKIEKYFSRLLPNLPRPLSRFDTPQRCLKGLTEK